VQASSHYRSTIAGLVLAAMAFAVMARGGMPLPQCWTAAVTVLCAVWWIFESIPLAATALVPLAVFPLSGVLTEKQAATAYSDPIVLLFMGGFMLSKAAESSGTHRRIAQAMIAAVGSTSGRRIVLAFMLATALCSMWISNTATALMMLPVALAVLESDTSGKLGVPLLLGVAYSASIGGIVTPIGSPPNGVFMAVYRETTGQSVPFHQWMLVAAPIAVLTLAAAWLILTWRLSGVPGVRIKTDDAWTSAQRRTLAVFGCAALAWITREIPFGGWSSLLQSWLGISQAGDSTVAIVAVIALFLIPNGAGSGQRLLDWPTAVQIPWGILLLFGGGIGIAKAFESSGLSTSIGGLVAAIQHWPVLALVGTICLGAALLTEVTSNTATANVLMPVLAAAAEAAHLEPTLLMVPATLAVSYAFMLPVATPPNAIVCGSGYVRIADMFRVGLVLDLVGVVIITLVCWGWLPHVIATGQQ
jgi:solute carrier family 13 (sodium-dependent dicarboxylate transporter), member 2/3/5